MPERYDPPIQSVMLSQSRSVLLSGGLQPGNTLRRTRCLWQRRIHPHGIPKRPYLLVVWPSPLLRCTVSRLVSKCVV